MFVATGTIVATVGLALPASASAGTTTGPEVEGVSPALTAAPLGAGGPTAGISAAGPTIYELQNNNLRPSTLQKDGGRPYVALGKSFQEVCAWRVYTYTSNAGGSVSGWKYNSSMRYVDYIEGYEDGGYRYYGMQAADCDGTVGPWRYATAFYPYVDDDDDVSLSGWPSPSYNANAFGNALRTKAGLGASAQVFTGYDRNTALYARTGPNGGIATVYVNGAKKGTVSFYSPTEKHRVLVYATGAPDAASRTIRLVMTGKGAKGGTTMTLDAVGRFAG